MLINIVERQSFIDMKKLCISDSYFVILNSGLYLYDFNNSYCSLIHTFNNNEYKGSGDNILITELYRGFISSFSVRLLRRVSIRFNRRIGALSGV